MKQRKKCKRLSVLLRPPFAASKAIIEAIDAEIDLIICITEGIPLRTCFMSKITC